MNPPTSGIGGRIVTLGRIVHFTCDVNAAQKLNQLGGRKYNIGDKCAAIVTYALDNNAVNLKLFADATDEIMHLPAVPYSSGNQAGTWNWAERTSETQEAAA